MAQLTGADAPAQRLLLPLTLELTDEELDAVEPHGEQLRRVGLRGRAVRRPGGGAARGAVAAPAVRRRRLLPRARGRPGARPLRRLGQPARAVRGHLRLPRGGQGRAAARRSARCASCCSGSSPPSCRRTTCTGARRSCSCRGRSWSAGLGGGSVPVVVGPTAVGKTAVALALAAHLAARGHLGRLAPGLSPARHRHRQADPQGARARPAPRPRPGRAGRALQRRALRAGRRRAGSAEIRDRGRLPVVVGGTGLYVRALAEGLFREPPLDAGAAPLARRLHRAARAARAAAVGRPARSRLPRAVGASAPPAPIEVALLTGRPLSHWQAGRARARPPSTRGTLCSPCPGRCCSSGSPGGPRRWCGAG